uniref:ZP domain-containing protein n=2 Tax=Plectus sambesii TaxID=2011161 RepID=A0A914VPE6_9BILA
MLATFFSNDPQPPPPVGNTTSPVGQLNMTLRDANGNDLNNVEAGTRVRVIIELNGDSYYNSELPEFCSVSNALNPMGTYIAVIADFCPYVDTITNSPFDFKAYQQDNRTYFFDFDAFLFDNQQTTLLISCYIQVCMNFTDCTRTCWPAGTAKERFIAAMSNRHSYRQTPVQFNGDIPLVANSSHGHNLTVTPRSSEVTTIVPTTTNGGLPDWALVLIILFVVFLILSLLLCFCCCVCCGVGLGLWSRRYGQHRDRRTEYIYPQTTSMPATFAADNASVHHMEIPKVNLNGSSGARSITSDKSYKY